MKKKPPLNKPLKNGLLMCPPDYYRIEYEINPWMSVKNPAIAEKARKQWESLYQVLTVNFRLAVELLKPRAGLPDLVFTANGGLVAGKKVILSNLKFPERQKERDYFKEWFIEKGYEVVSIPSEFAFEGEGDALWMGDLLFAGYPFRTDISAHPLIEDNLQCEVVSLELVDPKFYHLDTCFCPLNSLTALFVPGAFSSKSHKTLESKVQELIPLTPDEADLFASNAIVSGNKIIFQTGPETTRKKLEKAGFEVFPLDLSEFIKGGGNAKCLVLWL